MLNTGLVVLGDREEQPSASRKQPAAPPTPVRRSSVGLLEVPPHSSIFRSDVTPCDLSRLVSPPWLLAAMMLTNVYYNSATISK